MAKIAEAESINHADAPEPPREYYLTLYYQCLQVVSGEDAKDVLDADSE